MNKVLLVGRLTRDPELRTLPSGKHVTTFSLATNEYRGQTRESGRSTTPWSRGTAWPRSAASSWEGPAGGRRGAPQTRQWDDDAGKRHWKTEIIVNSLEMLSGRGKKEYAKEAQAAQDESETPVNGTSDEPLEAVVAM